MDGDPLADLIMRPERIEIALNEDGTSDLHLYEKDRPPLTNQVSTFAGFKSDLDAIRFASRFVEGGPL